MAARPTLSFVFLFQIELYAPLLALDCMGKGATRHSAGGACSTPHLSLLKQLCSTQSKTRICTSRLESSRALCTRGRGLGA